VNKIVLLAMILILFSCNKEPHKYTHSFFRMDTIIAITYTLSTTINDDTMYAEMDSILKAWDERYSIETDNSVVKKINNRIVQTVPVSKELGKMIKVALDYGDTLNGYFDLTVFPLKKIWGMSKDAPENSLLPESTTVDSVCKLINYKNVRVASTLDTLFFLSGATTVDIGGIAKVFALLDIKKVFEKNGITNYLINGGGDIIANGAKPDGSKWVVGIQHPRKTDKLIASFPLEMQSVFTSGDYERFKIVNNQRIHHIFNPKTGYSASKNQSITVYGPDPVENKFLSTGLFPKPSDSIMQFVNERTHLKCLVVDSTGKITVSSNWSDLQIVEH
jgi:FAD:protein FMN transferase